jgi:hypothetical protein
MFVPVFNIESMFHQQKQENPKQIWLLTYGAGCCSMTNTILATCGLIAEECYTATWRESKYTLIRLKKEHRLRRTAVVKIMKQLDDTHGIKGTEIFGFDTVSCNSQTHDESLSDHPGFKLMIDIMNTDISRLEAWTRQGSLVSNKKSLLWKYLENTNPEQMTRIQLINKIKEWGPVVENHEELKNTHAVLLAQHEETRKAYEEMLSRYETERQLNEEFMQQLKDKIKECGELQRELIRIRPMPQE